MWDHDSEKDFEVCSYSIGLTSGHGVTTTRGHFPTSKVISNDCAAQPVSNATVCDGWDRGGGGRLKSILAIEYRLYRIIQETFWYQISIPFVMDKYSLFNTITIKAQALHR